MTKVKSILRFLFWHGLGWLARKVERRARRNDTR